VVCTETLQREKEQNTWNILHKINKNILFIILLKLSVSGLATSIKKLLSN